jgi:hypothetical protein
MFQNFVSGCMSNIIMNQLNVCARQSSISTLKETEYRIERYLCCYKRSEVWRKENKENEMWMNIEKGIYSATKQGQYPLLHHNEKQR